MSRSIVVFVALVFLGCGPSHDTRIRIIVESELTAPEQIDAIDISVDSRAIGGERRTASVDLQGAATLPGTLGVTYRGDGLRLGPIRIDAVGTRSGTFVAADAAEATFVTGDEVIVRLFLRRACAGVECGEGERCEAGVCVGLTRDAGMEDASAPDGGVLDAGPLVCEAPLADCTIGAGCETDLESDPQHCGACGFDCEAPANSTSACAGGACSFVCAGDYADCNGEIADGCEIDLAFDPANCDACGRSCDSILGGSVASTHCLDGNCQIVACATGRFDCDGDEETGCECASGCFDGKCR